jgi:signal recognition particle subunit SRP54
MFENLSDRLDSVFKKLKGRGTLNEKNIEDGLKQVRMALLEADVNYRVAKSVISDIKKRALGQEVMHSLTPGQQVIKIVNEEFTKMMGSSRQDLNLDGRAMASIMLVGLQGSGKTTTAGKLGLYLRKKGRKPFLVPVDVYRPAAIDQLKKIGRQLDIPVFDSTTDMDPVQICQDALLAARHQGCDTLLLDTAGRLHTQTNLSEELKKMIRVAGKAVEGAPHRKLLILDGTQGSSSINQAKAFDEMIGIDGIIITKLDGTAKGGSVLSIADELKMPILYIGTGEQPKDLIKFKANDYINTILDEIFI